MSEAETRASDVRRPVREVVQFEYCLECLHAISCGGLCSFECSADVKSEEDREVGVALYRLESVARKPKRGIADVPGVG